MSYRLTDNEVTSFAMEANDYVKNEIPYTQILPVKRIPDGYTHKWYVSTEVDGPESSKDSRAVYDVRTARTEGEANIISYIYTFEIPVNEVTMARNANVPVWSENVGNAIRKMNDAVCHLQLRGSTAWDKVSITGMYTGGTVCGTALDAVMWNTPPAPITHLAAGYGDLNAAGFKPPYTWIISSNLMPGLVVKYGAGDPSHISMIGDFGVDNLFDVPNSGISTVVTTRYDLYPMGTPADDNGMWFLYKRDASNAYLAEVMPITTTIQPEIDFRRQCYHGRVEWRGTVAIVHATSICYEEQVDF